MPFGPSYCRRCRLRKPVRQALPRKAFKVVPPAPPIRPVLPSFPRSRLWGLVTPRGLPVLYGHRANAAMDRDVDERLALFEVVEVDANLATGPKK